MKKSIIIISALIFSVFAISLVAAQALPAPSDALSGVFGFLRDLFTLQGYDSALARFLIFMTVAIVLYMPSYIFTGKKSSALAMFLAALVSYFGVRFLTNETIIGIFLPYNALTIVIMTAIPFLLFSTVLEYYVTSKLIRKLGWGFMAATFVGLWLTRWGAIGEMAYIYALFSVVSFAILWFDGAIHAMFVKQKLGKGKSTHAYVVSADVTKRMNDLIEKLSIPNLTKEQKDAIKGEIMELEDEIKDLSKQV
jgi:hypothetical protein